MSVERIRRAREELYAALREEGFDKTVEGLSYAATGQPGFLDEHLFRLQHPFQTFRPGDRVRNTLTGLEHVVLEMIWDGCGARCDGLLVGTCLDSGILELIEAAPLPNPTPPEELERQRAAAPGVPEL